MGYRNREIEKKYVIDKKTTGYEDAKTQIKALLGKINRTIDESSRDYYWKPVKGQKGDFLRLRFMPDGSGQLTVKDADRGSNFNRVEIDVEVDDAAQCLEYQEYVHGDHYGSVFKSYYVMFLELDEHTTVSVYKVRGDTEGRIFVEIEAKTQARVEELNKLISKEVPLTYEPRSLYQIFVEGKKS